MSMLVFFYIASFLAIFFVASGILHLVRSLPMINTVAHKGKVKDARITTDNVIGEEFDNPNTFIYFTYLVDGIEHGSSTVSTINDSQSRNAIKKLCDKFEKEGPFDTTVFVSGSDSRKAYLIDSKDVRMTKLIVGVIFSVISVVLYFSQ